MNSKKESVSIVSFLGYEVDLDTPDNVIKIVFNNDGDEKRLNTSSLLKFQQSLDGNMDFAIKNSNDKLAVKPMIYTNDTLFLESNMSVKNKAKEFLRATGEKEVLVVKTFTNTYLGKNISNFSVVSERLKKDDLGLSESEQKDTLKAYETPSNMFEIYFSVMQHESIESKIEALLPSIRRELSSKKEVKEHFLFKMKNFSAEQEILIKMVLLAEISQTSKLRLESESENSNVRQMQSLIKLHYPEILERVSKIKDMLFPYQAFEDSVRIAVFDPQAGSGEGIFNGAKKSGIDVNLIGTEFRTFPELKNGEELKNNPNYNVITGIDSTMHLSDYENLFNNKNLRVASLNTLVYQNPPYTQNNELAKEGIEMLSHDQNIFGLFPTSMEGFLRDNINGFVFVVPKKLTGYTDPSVPENLLFVIGSKHDEEFVYEQMQSRKEKGLTLTTNIDVRAKNKVETIIHTDIESASKQILKTIRLSGNFYNFKSRMNKMVEYQSSRDGNSVLVEHLKAYIDNTKEKIENIEKIEELVEKNADKVMSVFSSSDTLKKEKLFPDYRSYNPEREYKKLTYNDVLLERGLLVFYRDKYPEIYKIIESLAKEDGIELGLGKPIHSEYSLSNPTKPNSKDIVATESLGLMKLAYYPTSFSLSNPLDKKSLLDILKHISQTKGSSISQNSLDALELIISDSNRLIVKNEDKIGTNLEINKEEVFVFVDEDGLDIAKLNVSLTDFYNAMNDLNMFDINDYVQKAVLSDDKKEVIFSNFLKYTENFIYSLEEFRKGNVPDDTPSLEKLALKSIVEIKKIKDDTSLNSESKDTKQLSVYNSFAQDNYIFEYFQRYVTISDPKSIIQENVLQNVFLESSPIESREKFLDGIAAMFDSMPISFYERQREQSEGFIRNGFKKLTENSSYSKEALSEAENDFVIDIYEQLSSEYEVRKSVSESAIKTAKMLIVNNSLINAYKSKGYSNSKLYDLFFENMMINTFGLMPHQFKNAERFIEISSDKKVDILNWEQRGGKSLTFTFEDIMLMFYKQIDANLFVETKTMNDITSQIMRHIPFAMNSISFNMPKSTAKSTIINPDFVNEFFTENSRVFANIPKILNPYFIKRGAGQKEELERFGFEFEELLSQVEKKGFTIEEMLEKYPDAKFRTILEKACV